MKVWISIERTGSGLVTRTLQPGRTKSKYMYIRPYDHKLRKFLSLKLNFEYLKFYCTNCLNYLQMWKNCFLKQIFKISFINKTTAKVILVWNFEADSRIFSVYGHWAWTQHYSYIITMLSYICKNKCIVRKTLFFLLYYVNAWDSI